jgi:hypothetical protein
MRKLVTIRHRYIDFLELIENEQTFWGRKILKKNKLLIIGTFNPDEDSCDSPNEATWFYGRYKNNFWDYVPHSLTGNNLHPCNGGTFEKWKRFCRGNHIIIVDLIKQIDHKTKLPNFKDKEINDRINPDLSNVTEFNFAKAFKGITFDKVIYTRKTWHPKNNADIGKLIKIKDFVNETLINKKIIGAGDNIIHYCPAPWQKRPSTRQQWQDALNR